MRFVSIVLFLAVLAAVAVAGCAPQPTPTPPAPPSPVIRVVTPTPMPLPPATKGEIGLPLKTGNWEYQVIGAATKTAAIVSKAGGRIAAPRVEAGGRPVTGTFAVALLKVKNVGKEEASIIDNVFMSLDDQGVSAKINVDGAINARLAYLTPASAMSRIKPGEETVMAVPFAVHFRATQVVIVPVAGDAYGVPISLE